VVKEDRNFRKRAAQKAEKVYIGDCFDTALDATRIQNYGRAMYAALDQINPPEFLGMSFEGRETGVAARA